jgi:hypothetical protein
MTYRSTNRSSHEPTVSFDYAALDDEEPVDLDQLFWTTEGAVLVGLLQWMTLPADCLSEVGARAVSVALRLNPKLISRNIAAQVASLPDDQATTADLSKVLIEIEERLRRNF